MQQKSRKSITFRLEIIQELHDIGGLNWQEIGDNIGETARNAEETYYYIQHREKKIAASQRYYINNTAAHRRNRKKNYDKYPRWKLKNKMFVADMIVEYHDYASYNFREIAEHFGLEPREAYHKYLNAKDRQRHNSRRLAILRQDAA
jgi:hypothetical protein